MANQRNPENPNAAQKQQNQQNPNERDRQNQQQQGSPSRQPDAQRQQAQGNPGKDSMVGKDTDGDGKVVKPGQTPGQSHGTGIKPDQKR